MNTNEMLCALAQARGVAGNESEAARLAAEWLSAFSTVKIDGFGNVIAEVIPSSENQKHFLLDAHIDSIGMAVREITDKGLLKVVSVGGLDERTLPTASVTVYTTNGALKGIVCDAKNGENPQEVSKVDDVQIDLGLPVESVKQLVKPGDRVAVNMPVVELKNSQLSGSFLDDRSGCVAVILAAQALKKENPACGVTVLLSTREEVGGQGAQVATYSVSPTHAIVVDVSFGKTADKDAENLAKLGSGAMIGISPYLSSAMSGKLQQVAEEKKIPYTMEVMGGRTGTNADEIVISRAGVQTALLSIPQKYMHMPVEVVHTSDVEAVANLITAYVLAEVSL